MILVCLLGCGHGRIELERERQATSTGGSSPQLVEPVPQAERGKARDKAGKEFGVSGGQQDRLLSVDPINDDDVIDLN